MIGRSTQILRTFQLDSKNLILIEKVQGLNGRIHYTVGSVSKSLFGKRVTSLSAWNIETNFNGSRIVKIEFKEFRMLKQAIDFAKHIKSNIYPNWIKHN